MRLRNLLAMAICCVMVGMAASQEPGSEYSEYSDDRFDRLDTDSSGDMSKFNDDGSLKANIICIDEIDLTVSDPGILTLAPDEGQLITAGDVIATTDDQDTKARRLVAFYAWQAVEKELESDIRIRYARKNMQVAKASYDDAVEANQRAKKAVSENEIRRRKFDWEAGGLNIENIEHEMSVTTITAREKKAEYDAATLMLRHHEVKAPIPGMVEERTLGKGSYVRPGDPICHIVRLDRMRAEAFVPIHFRSPAELKGLPVTVKVMVGYQDGQPRYESFKSTIGFVSSSIDVNDNIRVWAEFENRGDFVVRKGMQASIAF